MPNSILSQEQRQLLNSVKKEIQRGLPGIDAQNKLSPVTAAAKYRKAPTNHRKACVMGLIYPEGNELRMAFIERTFSHPDDKHGGQISFPGGKLEPEDETYLIGALREVEEEIGIPPEQITVLGQLTDLYVFASNFLVYPFLGYMENAPRFVPQVEEVASIVSFPIDRLMSADIIDTKDLVVREYTMKDVPYYKLNEHVLWGATAMITSEIVELIERAKTAIEAKVG